MMLLVMACDDEGTVNNDWTAITDCIMNVAIDYQSGVTVTDPSGVGQAFNEYINFAKTNNQDIFGYGNNWRFDNASKHGLYNNVKYWKVSASSFSAVDNQWHRQDVFDVSEDGKVVRLLGCI
jgi:hypothetical protein